jgi:hypothetical protein
MSELERNLSALAAELEWPPTPHVQLRLAERPRRIPRLAIAVALVALAIAVAFAVPQARSAILRFFDIGGVTIIRVDTLPPAQERELSADLGRPVSRSEAARALLAPVRLPKLHGRAHLYEQSGVVSTLLSTPQPVLLNQLRTGLSSAFPQKLVGPTTKLETAKVRTAGDALWLTGKRHIVLLPDAPLRLAGNVLIWSYNGISFRLEGRTLDERTALRLAREITP